MADPDLLTPKQAADKLGQSKNQVYRRIHAGVLPAVAGTQRNAKYLIRPSDLEAYIAAGQPGWSDAEQDMMTVPQVARKIGFTDATVRRLCYTGVLAFTRGSGSRGHLRIHRASVEEYLAGETRVY